MYKNSSRVGIYYYYGNEDANHNNSTRNKRSSIFVVLLITTNLTYDLNVAFLLAIATLTEDSSVLIHQLAKYLFQDI